MTEQKLQTDDLDTLLEGMQHKENESEVERLQRLLITFKKKYQRALLDLSEKEKENNIDIRLTEAQEENQILISQQKLLRDLVKKEQANYQAIEQKLKFTTEALKYSEEQNRRYQSDLGKPTQVCHASNNKITEDEIESLITERDILKAEKKELSEKLWLAKEAEKQLKPTDLSNPTSDYLNKIALWAKNQAEMSPSSLSFCEINKSDLMQKLNIFKNLNNTNNLNDLNNLNITDTNTDTNTTETNTVDTKTIEPTSYPEFLALQKEKENITLELESLKQSFALGARETKEIKHYYQKVLNEKAVALQKNTQMQKSLYDLRCVIEQKDRDIEIIKTQVEAMKSEQIRNERQLELEREQQKIFERKVKERDENIASFTEQIQTLQSRIKNTDDIINKKNDAVIEAQQHLAKKMKEYSTLTEKSEEYQRELTRLQNELTNTKERLTETQTNLEHMKEQEKKYQDQIANWEDKYLKAYEKLKNFEAQNKELRKIEEKHEQLQNLLANLGNVIGTPVGMAKTTTQGQVQNGPKQQTQSSEVEQSQNKEQMNIIYATPYTHNIQSTQTNNQTRNPTLDQVEVPIPPPVQTTTIGEVGSSMFVGSEKQKNQQLKEREDHEEGKEREESQKRDQTQQFQKPKELKLRPTVQHPVAVEASLFDKPMGDTKYKNDLFE